MKKNKVRAQKKSSRYGDSYWWLAVIVILVGFAFWPKSTPKKFQVATAIPPPVVLSEEYDETAHQLSKQLFDQIYNGLATNLPQNSYYPPGLRSRLDWIKDKKQAGVLEFEFSRKVVDVFGVDQSKKVIAAGGYRGGKYYIHVSGQKMYYHGVRPYGGVRQEVVTGWKHYIASALAHEVIHLENLRFHIEHPRPTHEQSLDEETRAYMVGSQEIVGPLKLLRQNIGSDGFSLADDLSKGCGYRLPCETLRRQLNDMGASLN